MIDWIMREMPRSNRVDLLEVLTVGAPFCGFKILSGLSLRGSGHLGVEIFGSLFICLGLMDALINAVNFGGLLVKGRRPMAACSIALAMRPRQNPSGTHRKWHELGNSLDVLLSFALVALMIGAGRLRAMPPDRLAAWNACVILNVLGAGLGRFGDSLRNLSREE